MKCEVINDVKLFPAVYHRIYCHKILMLANQTSRYKSKCIRMHHFIAVAEVRTISQTLFILDKHVSDSEGPDEMRHEAAFHQSLYCLQIAKIKQSSRTDIHEHHIVL